MKAINKTELGKIMRDVKSQIKGGRDISNVEVKGFEFNSVNGIYTEDFTFSGKAVNLIEKQFDCPVEHYVIYSGIEIAFDEEANELNAYAKFKATTDYEVLIDYILVHEMSV